MYHYLKNKLTPLSKESSAEDKKEKQIKRMSKIYEKTLDLRNFEIQNLTTRNNFILAVNTALFTYASREKSIYILSLGIVISILQIRMAAGAKLWQEFWEDKLSEMELMLSSVYKGEVFKDDDFIHLFNTPSKNTSENNRVNIKNIK